jgi:hypothetical protein
VEEESLRNRLTIQVTSDLKIPPKMLWIRSRSGATLGPSPSPNAPTPTSSLASRKEDGGARAPLEEAACPLPPPPWRHGRISRAGGGGGGGSPFHWLGSDLPMSSREGGQQPAATPPPFVTTTTACSRTLASSTMGAETGLTRSSWTSVVAAGPTLAEILSPSRAESRER